jgi:hypothetical protein
MIEFSFHRLWAKSVGQEFRSSRLKYCPVARPDSDKKLYSGAYIITFFEISNLFCQNSAASISI